MTSLLVLSLAIGVVLAQSPSVAPDPLVGLYICHGTQDGGKAYTVRLQVDPIGQTYQLVWRLKDDTALVVLVGLGIRDGERLAVALIGPNHGVGVALYLISPSQLAGVWSRGDGAQETERCVVSAREKAA